MGNVITGEATTDGAFTAVGTGTFTVGTAIGEDTGVPTGTIAGDTAPDGVVAAAGAKGDVGVNGVAIGETMEFGAVALMGVAKGATVGTVSGDELRFEASITGVAVGDWTVESTGEAATGRFTGTAIGALTGASVDKATGVTSGTSVGVGKV